MRDYRETIAGLRGAAKGLREIDMPKTADQMDAAANAIEELVAERDGWIEQERKMLIKSVPKWISVEERLPEDGGYTIVFCADGERRHVTFAKFQKTPKRWELTGTRSYWHVTHWMPLPSAPKEET